MISFTRPSSPLFFSRGGARRGRPGYEASPGFCSRYYFFQIRTDLGSLESCSKQLNANLVHCYQLHLYFASDSCKSVQNACLVVKILYRVLSGRELNLQSTIQRIASLLSTHERMHVRVTVVGLCVCLSLTDFEETGLF